LADNIRPGAGLEISEGDYGDVQGDLVQACFLEVRRVHRGITNMQDLDSADLDQVAIILNLCKLARLMAKGKHGDPHVFMSQLH